MASNTTILKAFSRFFFVIQLIGILVCIVILTMPKEFFCFRERSVTEIVKNISINNAVQCETVGIKLGFGTTELDKIDDFEHLIKIWINDRLHNGPHLYSRVSLANMIEDEGYNTHEQDMILIKAFEGCLTVVYMAATGAMYMILLLSFTSLVTMVGCVSTNVDSNFYWSRLKVFRTNRLRRDSEKTWKQSSITIKNPTYTNNITVNIDGRSLGCLNCLRLTFLSCGPGRSRRKSSGQDRETEREGTSPRLLFKKDVDGTLRREGVQLVYEAMKSVGILFTKQNGRGTVVRIGSHHVITAWHVIKDIVLPSTRAFQNLGIDAKLLSDKTIYVDFHESCRQSPVHMHFGILPKITFLDVDLDIAVLELDVSGKEEYLPAPIKHFADVFKLNSMTNQVCCVHIIGQHPTEENVVVDPGCKIITRDDHNVKTARKWIKQHMTSLKKTAKKHNENPSHIESAYYDVFATGKRLIFNTFLEFGGSGGAVIVLLPEGGVALVAILTHGLPPFYWYAAASHTFPKNMRMEVGCTMTAIIKSTEWKGSEELRDELFKNASEKEVSEPMETDDSKAEGPEDDTNTLAEKLKKMSITASSEVKLPSKNAQYHVDD